MTAANALKKHSGRFPVKILATDIDTLALARARKGEFYQSVIKGMSKADLQTYFNVNKDKADFVYHVKPSLRQMVSFNYLNFNTKKWPMKGPFHMIFCRNALIYFDRPKQHEFVNKMKNLLVPGGFLYLGHSEHSVTEGHGFKLCGQTVYQKPI